MKGYEFFHKIPENSAGKNLHLAVHSERIFGLNSMKKAQTLFTGLDFRLHVNMIIKTGCIRLAPDLRTHLPVSIASFLSPPNSYFSVPSYHCCPFLDHLTNPGKAFPEFNLQSLKTSNRADIVDSF